MQLFHTPISTMHCFLAQSWSCPATTVATAADVASLLCKGELLHMLSSLPSIYQAQLLTVLIWCSSSVVASSVTAILSQKRISDWRGSSRSLKVSCPFSHEITAVERLNRFVELRTHNITDVERFVRFVEQRTPRFGTARPNNPLDICVHDVCSSASGSSV